MSKTRLSHISKPKLYRCKFCRWKWYSRWNPVECPKCKNRVGKEPKNSPRRMW